VKILAVHNYYQQPGGEDQVFVAEGKLLEDHDHSVLRYIVHNDRVANASPPALARDTVWNREVYGELRSLIRRELPEVIHFHNTFPIVSPAAYYAARAEGVPVVQTLHNYRLLCPNALFFRDGHVCEDCLGKSVPWPGVTHACYRGSRLATGAVTAMLTVHRALRTWTEMVDVYVALTDFAREKFIEGGLPAGKIEVKPNFVHADPGVGKGGGEYALFVGRLSQEKGIDTLLAAWEQLGDQVHLKIVGDGPLAARVVEATKRFRGVEWLGSQPKDRVLTLMKDARILLIPSVWYEGFPMVIAEAYAVGLPVVASDLGSMSSLVDPGRTGLHVRPGDPIDLIDKVEWTLMHPANLERMRGEARAEFEGRYTAEINHGRLVEIYELAAREARARA
jgi:glycosyltransferase involved in cell wall biosynthesis